MKKQLLILMTLCISFIGYSQAVGDTFIDNYFTYRITSLSPDEVEIIDYNINGGIDVVIPASVTPNASSKSSLVKVASKQLATYAVTGIAINAFNSKGIYSVDIPDSVLTIGNQAFGVNYITTVSLGNGVTSIGFSAFYNNNLTTIVIPDSVIEIQGRAFDDNLLTSVTIPSNVQTIGLAAFRDNLITCVTSKATTPPTIVTDGSGNSDTFNIDRSGINLYIPSGTAAAYSSASWTGFNSVTETQGNTFVLDYITYQITSANTVTTTDYNTAGGTVVNIPATVEHACITYSVTKIGNNAFYNNGLTDVSIPNSVFAIGDNSVRGNNLSSVTIPDSVISIGWLAFGYNQLVQVTLSNNLINIGKEAFIFNDLTTVTIPNSVITIEDGAFAQNNNMTGLVLGNSVETIGSYAFRFTGLTNVTIPASVTYIANLAFGLHLLTDVYCEGLVPPVIETTGAPNTDTFDVYRSNIHLHIPTGTMGAYVTNPGALWTDFASVTEDALSVSDFEIVNDIKVITKEDKIRITASNSINLKSYALYNISGKKIDSGFKSEIATSTFSKGIYILKLDFDKGTTIKKVIIN